MRKNQLMCTMTVEPTYMIGIKSNHEEIKDVEPKESSMAKEVYRFYQNDRIVTCVLTSGNIKGVGIAKCHPEDCFDIEDGIALSEIRARIDLLNNALKRVVF